MEDGNDKKENRNLTRYQISFLRQLPMSLDQLRKRKQGTVGACFHRGLFEIRKQMATRTTLGDEVMHEQTHADVRRATATLDAPFAAIIRQLTEHAGRGPKLVMHRKVA